MSVNNDKSVGDAVRQARETAGMNQTALAAKMRELGHRWTQPTVVAVEKGERPLRWSEGMDLRGIAGFDTGLRDDEAMELAALRDFRNQILSATRGIA